MKHFTTFQTSFIQIISFNPLRNFRRLKNCYTHLTGEKTKAEMI